MKYLHLLRHAAYTIEIILFFIIQQTPGLIPSVYGILPTLLIPAVCSVAMFENPLCALAYGVFGGFLLDYGTNAVFGFHALILGVICFIISFLVQDVFHNNFLTGLIMTLTAIVVVLLLQWLFLYAAKGYDSPVYVLYRHYLPRMAYTLCTVPVFYYFNRGLSYLFRKKHPKG